MKKKNSVSLDATWKIHSQLKGSKLTAAALKKVHKEVEIIQHFFGTSNLNSVVLCSVVQESLLEGDVDLKILAQHYKIDNRQLIYLTQAIEELLETGLVEKCDRHFSRNGRKIAPAPKVVDALIRGDDSKVRTKEINGLATFFSEFSQIQALRKMGNIDCDQYLEQVQRLCERSRHLPGIHYFLSFDLTPLELTFLICIAYTAFQGVEMADVVDIVKEITDSHADYYGWCGRIRRKEISLFKEGLIEFSLFELGIDTDVSLTQISSEQLFTQETQLVRQVFKPTLTHYLTPQNIHPIELIFDEQLKKGLAGIRRSLMPEHYRVLQSRMKEKNLRCGFTILLYGQPGTGKTESVYQIARESNRVVLRLEISKIKAMWVGESEKNLKKVFTEYKRACRSHDYDPILLFNEADAIFSRRRDVGSSVDQMENSLQNILLQELEEFEGILIATTNLTQNLDAAFERRFLYKLEFKVPSAETRLKLLQSSFKELNTEQLNEIALSYEFSGNTIQNIKRKLLLSELLEPSICQNPQMLKKLFAEETIGLNAKTQLGFKIGTL